MELNVKKIRNIALVGHSGSGKTSLAEAMLYVSGGTDRLGNTTDGNTVCDYDPEEIKRGFSLQTTIAPVIWKDTKINILNTPGFLDFSGEVMEALRVADSAIIVVDGKAGVEAGTELGWDNATDMGLPKCFFINNFDDPEARFAKVFTQLRETFGVRVCPVCIPMIDGDKVIGFIDLVDMKDYVFDGKGGYVSSAIPDQFASVTEEYRNILLESIAETSEELMEKFFSGEEIGRIEALNAIHEGIIDGSIVPVFCGAATKLWGVETFMDAIVDSFPRHTAKKAERVVVDGEIKAKEINPDGDADIFVFKTVADPFVGKMSFFKVMNGNLKRDSILKNTTTGQTEKFSHIYTVKGKKQTEVDSLCCGDIGMTAKLVNTNTNDTLTMSASADTKYAPIVFPEPFYTKAVVPTAKGDEDKISGGISKLLEEDLTLKYRNNAETHQLLLSGMGDIHLDVIVCKLKSRFGTSVNFEEPKTAYRETIKGKSDVEGKHKKQSGGSGQYGHVKIRFSHGEDEGLTFTQSVVGGTVPKNYYPAVEKGLEEAMQKGVLAGYPVVNLAADLYDGSYHPVDSNEISFKLAARLAYKEGLPKANPVLLEPVGTLYATVPEGIVGDVIGDLNKRRGKMLGMESVEGKKGYTRIEAEVPAAEMNDYTISLRAMSQGRGKFTYAFARYEEVPGNVAQKIIAEAKNDEE